MSRTGSDVVTPELALVDPELAKAQRQIPDRKAAMSSSTPSNGTFFIDPAQPEAAPASPELAAVPSPLIESVEVAAEPVAPVPEPEPPAPPPAAKMTQHHVPATAAAALIDDGSTPMRDVPLGTLIFRAGLLAEEQLEDALQEGMRSGKRLGEVLLERGWLHERDLGRLLAGQKGLPFVEVRASDAEATALQMVSEEKARLQTALPLRYEDGQLVVAVADPSNELVLENLRRTLGSEPRLVVALQSELIRAIDEAYASVATQGTALRQEPAPQPEPILVQEPAAQPETTHLPEPARQPEQVAMAPAVTQMPTVPPSVETRDADPVQAPLLQSPFVIEPGAETVEPEPLVVEPIVPVEETPSPLLEQPSLQQEPTLVPQAITPPAAPPVEADPAPLEPLLPVSTPSQPPVEPIEAQPAPEAPPVPFVAPPAAEQPLVSAPAPLEEAVAPRPPETPAATPAPSEQPQPGTSSIHAVLLRLRDGETLEVGTFNTAAEASACAQDVVREIAAAEADATWPFFGDRYLRPNAIVSVDLLEESADKWLGSAVRTRWAGSQSS